MTLSVLTDNMERLTGFSGSCSQHGCYYRTAWAVNLPALMY